MCWCSLNSEALSTQARSQLQSLVERLMVTVYVCVDRYVCVATGVGSVEKRRWGL
jgi:hypothetical protein